MSEANVDIVGILRRLAQGEFLPEPVRLDGIRPMVFGHSLAEDGATSEELQETVQTLPEGIRRFWRLSRWARLFEDKTYGQWGLVILEPPAATATTQEFLKRRTSDSVCGDVIVGRFLGDSDLLLVRCDPSADDFGAVLVAAPIDPRPDWNVVARSFGEFLRLYVEAQGRKYWARGGI